jgi:hypothetical protein
LTTSPPALSHRGGLRGSGDADVSVGAAQARDQQFAGLLIGLVSALTTWRCRNPPDFGRPIAVSGTVDETKWSP